MYAQSCLPQLQAGRSLTSQLLCRQAAMCRQHSLPCCSSRGLHTSSIQQPSRCGSLARLPLVHSSSSRSSSRRRQRLRQLAPRAAVEMWPSLQRRSRRGYINRLNEEHGVDGFFEFYQSAASGQPVAYLMHPRGHTLEIHLQGATITRWLKPDGEDLLHVRSDATLEPGEAINSGIPLAFPQWRDGELPFNGFADKLEWEVVGTDFDGEFVNHAIDYEDWTSGDVQLAVDENAEALLPRPEGLLDDDEDIRPDLAELMEEEEEEEEGEEQPSDSQAAAAAKQGDPLAEQQEQEEGEEAGKGERMAIDEEDIVDGMGYGIIEDPAPCIILKLEDNAQTREIWPHKFELYYKITLMETDDFPDPKEGLPQGLMPYEGSDAPLSPEDAALREMIHGDDEELAEAAAAEAAERLRASNIKAGRYVPAIYSEREAEVDHPLPGQPSYTGLRLYTDEAGQMHDEETLEEQLEQESDEPKLRGAAAASVSAAKKKRASKGKAAAGAAEDADAEDAAVEDAAADAAGKEVEESEDDEGEEVPPGMYNEADPPMQIKMEWVLINKDPEGSEPLSFQLGALSHFATEDQMKVGEFVRVLGLGGTTTFDWSNDSRKKRLVGNTEDYVVFDGDRRETVYVGSHDAEVSFCPGSRTHFEIMARKGVPDHVVWHPGATGLPGLEVEPRFFAQVGVGRLALPKKLAPGEMWKGEYVIRYHERYWDPPLFDRDGPQPMPKLVTQRDDADDREEIDDEHIVEGVVGSSLGGGPNVPYLDQ